MNTFLVIGSNCFTGAHIVDALLERPDHRVIGVSRSAEYKDIFLPYKRHGTSAFEFHQIDVVRGFDRLRAVLERERPRVVINVAALSDVALSNESPVEYFDINTTAIVRLCNYLRTTSYLERYVHISSAEIFGACSAPVTEDALFNPSTPYAVSKASADMYLNVLLRNFGFPVTIMRSTNVYGKHQQLYKIIPRTVIYLKLNKTIELHGGGKALKSFIHIRDVVHGMMLAIERGSPGTYHFSVPSDQTVADVVSEICRWMGYEFESVARVVGERLGQDARYWLDCSKANGTLGWHPKVTFEEGVKEVIGWINDKWKDILEQPLEFQHRP